MNRRPVTNGPAACLFLLALASSAGEPAREALRDLGLPRSDPPGFRRIEASAEAVPLHARFELRFDPGGAYLNPFDPREIDVQAEFRAPSGRILRIPGFFYVPFERDAGGSPRRAGPPVWKARMAPDEPGTWRYRLTVTDRSGTARSPEGRFACLPSDSPGFVRVSHSRPRLLEFESGAPFVPLGLNLFHMTRLGRPIPPDRLASCESHVRRLADGGGNFARLRMDSWWLAIEMTPDEETGHLGLGWYHPQTGWEIDRLYDLCAERDVHLMHCLWNGNAVVNHVASEWRRPYNPYLRENGGPLEDRTGFWDDPRALDLQRRKIRYTVARWGYSRHLMSWELVNEANLLPDIADRAAEWHREMAREIRKLDPWRRPVTTSLMGNPELRRAIWELPEIGIVQEHVYGVTDMAEAMRVWLELEGEPVGKPYLFGEYGPPPEHAPLETDPEGVLFHNGLWASVLGGGAGAAYWFLDRLDRHDLYARFGPLRRWLEDLPLGSPDLRPLEGVGFELEREPEAGVETDLPLSTHSFWVFRLPPGNRFTVDAGGEPHPSGFLRPHLYAAPGRKAPPVFEFDSPRPFEFVVRVVTSVGDESNALRVERDGRLELERPFPAGPDHGIRSRHIPGFGNWVSVYDEEVVIPVPAGRRTLRLECVGRDRLEVEYALRGYQPFERAHPLRFLGQAGGGRAWGWVRNRLSTLHSVRSGLAPIPVEGFRIRVPGMPPGEYRYEWHDPWADEPAGEGPVTVAGDGIAVFPVPRITRDAAWKLIPRNSALPPRAGP